MYDCGTEHGKLIACHGTRVKACEINSGKRITNSSLPTAGMSISIFAGCATFYPGQYPASIEALEHRWALNIAALGRGPRLAADRGPPAMLLI
jgi:hypothetical protein